jgi:hypothetical protein
MVDTEVMTTIAPVFFHRLNMSRSRIKIGKKGGHYGGKGYD